MRQIKIEHELASPPDAVFARLTDFANLQKWRSVERVRLVPPGPAHVGTHIFTSVKAMWRRIQMENEITALDPGSHYYADRFVNGQYPVQTTWWVQSSGAGSRLTWTTDYEATGLMAFTPGWLERRLRTAQELDIQRLKKLLGE
jgi:carbon monoxide dehydrogenase subunit G